MQIWIATDWILLFIIPQNYWGRFDFFLHWLSCQTYPGGHDCSIGAPIIPVRKYLNECEFWDLVNNYLLSKHSKLFNLCYFLTAFTLKGTLWCTHYSQAGKDCRKDKQHKQNYTAAVAKHFRQILANMGSNEKLFLDWTLNS